MGQCHSLVYPVEKGRIEAHNIRAYERYADGTGRGF
jgi:hypothetical protein